MSETLERVTYVRCAYCGSLSGLGPGLNSCASCGGPLKMPDPTASRWLASERRRLGTTTFEMGTTEWVTYRGTTG